MQVHITDSKEAKEFFMHRGITISEDSAFNAVTLIDEGSGEKLVLWSEFDLIDPCSMPGIFIDEPDPKSENPDAPDDGNETW